MKVNWNRFAGLFVLFSAVLLMSGCTPAWIGAAEALLPAISAAISAILAFVMSLEGKTIPADVSATIQKILNGIKTELDNLKQLIDAAQSGGASVISKIEAVLNSILANLSSILSGLSINDSPTLQKITEFIGIAIAAVQAILTVVSHATGQLKTAAGPQLEALDNATATTIKTAHKSLQNSYKEIVGTPTDNFQVNEALGALPQQLP